MSTSVAQNSKKTTSQHKDFQNSEVRKKFTQADWDDAKGFLNDNFDRIADQLVNRKRRNQCQCPDPNHEDTHASAHIYGDHIHCFVCQKTWYATNLIGLVCGIQDYPDQLREGYRILGHSLPELLADDREYTPTYTYQKKEKPVVKAAQGLDEIRAKRHKAYLELCDRLSLNDEHRENLTNRGMPESQLGRYLSVSAYQPIGNIAIPGSSFGKLVNKDDGFLCPVEQYGSVVAFQVRTKDPRNKYKWLSNQGDYKIANESPLSVLMGSDPEKPILSEGFLKTELIHLFTGATCIGAAGGNWLSGKAQLLEYCKKESPAIVRILADADSLSNFAVATRIIRQCEELVEMGLLPLIADYGQLIGKNVPSPDDWLNEGGDFDKINWIPLEKFVARFESTEQSAKATSTPKKIKPKEEKKPDSQWADEIANDNLDRLAWDEEIKEWREYDSGKWKIISPLKISAVIKERFASEGKGFGIARITSIQNILKINLFTEKFDGNADLIPFADGVYSLSENKLLPHSPDYKLTWQLPHSFENESNEWEKIDEWLTFATKGNQRDKNILIAFAAATLKGKSDLQKFLLLLGIGGSGKGTYIRLLEDLVGAENCYSSSLVTWNSNQFESANGYGKRLVSFPDEIGKISNIEGLKKLTGGDSIRFEEKGKKATNYRFTGMVVIAANDSPFVGDSVSAIARRQIEIGFTNAVASRDRRNLNKEFKPELPAFSRYLLGLSDEWIEKHLRGGDSFGGALTSQSWENRCKVESIAGWLDEWAIFGDFTTPIGNTKAAIDTKYDDCESLYQSYTLYCSQNNQAPKSLRRFSGDLIEIATVIGKNLLKTHTRSGKVIKGLRLRMDQLDATIPTFTEILASAENLDTDVTVTDVTVTDVTVTDVTVTDVTVTDVTDIVTDAVTDAVTDETFTQQGRDGCDGLSPQILNEHYQLTDAESKEVANDLLSATKADDIQTFNLLREIYSLTNSLTNKKRVWGCMSLSEQELIRDFISRHK